MEGVLKKRALIMDESAVELIRSIVGFDVSECDEDTSIEAILNDMLVHLSPSHTNPPTCRLFTTPGNIVFLVSLEVTNTKEFQRQSNEFLKNKKLYWSIIHDEKPYFCSMERRIFRLIINLPPEAKIAYLKEYERDNIYLGLQENVPDLLKNPSNASTDDIVHYNFWVDNLHHDIAPFFYL